MSGINVSDIVIVKAKCAVPYWEDATVDGVEDVSGTRIPCRVGNHWCPEIDARSGRILNWRKGVRASINFKVRDGGTYRVCDSHRLTIGEFDGYVPPFMSPDDGSKGGDFLIMSVDGDGWISGWSYSLVKEVVAREFVPVLPKGVPGQPLLSNSLVYDIKTMLGSDPSKGVSLLYMGPVANRPGHAVVAVTISRRCDEISIEGAEVWTEPRTTMTTHILLEDLAALPQEWAP